MTTLNGLPAHVLLVHAVVVLLPLCAVLLVATAVWPAVRRRLAGVGALLAVLTLALVPLTTSAGEWLQERVSETDLVRTHAELGDTALFVALPVAALAVLVWWRGRERDLGDTAGATPSSRGPGPGAAPAAARRRTYLAPGSLLVTRVVAAAAILAAGAATYDVYLIGDSGARASWQDRLGQPEQAVAPSQDGDG